MATTHSIKQGGLELLSLDRDTYEQDSTNLQNHEQAKWHEKGSTRFFFCEFFSPSSVANYKHAAYDSGTPQTTDNWRLRKTFWGSIATYFTPPVPPLAVLVDRTPGEVAIRIWTDMASPTESQKSWHSCSSCSCTVKCPKLTWKFPSPSLTFTNSLTPFREAY